ncbi:DUF3899 domain-containing protein [Pediococcus argentinicus]|uniref:DUF3899 domain-containing protein n=1 Tax=Pediococcus argentinicus TaxID=480391 RepID=UPI0033903F4E
MTRQNKLIAIVLGVTVLGIIAELIFKNILISNIFFIIGILTLLVGVGVMLYDSKLLFGIFKRKSPVEPDEKLDVHKVASTKNEPIRFRPTARLTLILGAWLIAVSVLVSLF